MSDRAELARRLQRDLAERLHLSEADTRWLMHRILRHIRDLARTR